MYLEMFNLSGRTAVVTGGGRAIGLACVQALAEAGAKVVIADLDSKVAAARPFLDEVDHGRTAYVRSLGRTLFRRGAGAARAEGEKRTAPTERVGGPGADEKPSSLFDPANQDPLH